MMPSQARKSKEQELMQEWWVRICLAAIFLALTYGFASMAINSGSLFQYAITFVLAYWAVAHLIRGIRRILG